MSEAAFCPSCGSPRVTGARFCGGCGRPLEDDVGPLPATSQPKPRRGVNIAEAVVVVLILGALATGGVLVAAKMSAPAPLAAAAPTSRPATPEPTVESTAAPSFVPVDEYQATRGEAVPLVGTNGDDLGTVTVQEGKKYTKVGEYLTADSGRAWVGARVEYVAHAEFSYNIFDWVAHDDKGNQYEPLGMARDPALQAGTLAKGRKVTGWIAFEVPAGTKRLWVDYHTSGGEVIFSVPVL